jgi:hypothetical protein
VEQLLAIITVGCDGRPTAPVRQCLSGGTLLQRAADRLREVAPWRAVVSVPAGTPPALVRATGLSALVRPTGADRLEQAVAQALDHAPDATQVLALDPLLPLVRPGRLAAAFTLARREQADCVFSCHRESALLWHRSPMGLVPYFDPARRPDLGGVADDLPWLREDGAFYLLAARAFRAAGTRHCGRIAPLETDAAEAVLAIDSAGLAVCRALLAEASRAGGAGTGAPLPVADAATG